MKTVLPLLACVSLFILTSFTPHHKTPTLIHFTRVENGQVIKVSVISIDRYTANEDIIATCATLANDKVKLTFDKLIFGRSVLGIFGRNRVKRVEGRIELRNGSSEQFRAGGITNFRSLKIQISQSPIERIEMIETID